MASDFPDIRLPAGLLRWRGSNAPNSIMTSKQVVILHVDDSPSDRLLFRAVLEQMGMAGSLRSVDDGGEAIAYLNGKGKFADRKLYPWPSVIITDIQMPVIDGLVLLRMLKANPDWATVPVIVLSSSEDPEHQRLARSLGANSYLVKPNSFRDLFSIIEVASRKFRPRGAGTPNGKPTNSERRFGMKVVRQPEPPSPEAA